MSDRYRLARSDKGREHAHPTHPILLLITVLIRSAIMSVVIATINSPIKTDPFFFSFFVFSFSSIYSSSSSEETISGL